MPNRPRRAPPAPLTPRSPAARGHPAALFLALLVALAAWCGPAIGQPAAVPGAPYVPTPDPVVDAALELAGTGPGDRVVDLGSGDGRIPLRAVTRFRAASGFGVEIDPALVRLANDNARAAGVADRVRFAEGDLFAADVRAATVVAVYLLPSMMGRVEHKLRAELTPGARVVVHDYPFPDWQPERVVRSESPEKVRATGETTVVLYLYRVPAQPR